MAESNKNGQIAKDFVVATLYNPNSILKASDITLFANNIVTLYKTILNLLEADNSTSGEVEVHRPY
jgi:hypothetical protein